MKNPLSTATPVSLQRVPAAIVDAPRLPSGQSASDNGELAAVSEPALEPAHDEFAAFHQGYAWNAIALADTKAVWSFTVCGGTLGYFVAQEPVRSHILALPWSGVAALASISVALLAIATFFAFQVIVPRLTSSADGVVYFGSVARRPNADAFITDIVRTTPAALTRARLTHSYDLSRIADRKYRRLRISMWFGLFGLVTAAIALAFGATEAPGAASRVDSRDVAPQVASVSRTR